MDHVLALTGRLLSPGWGKDISGYAAAALVLATFCMGSMRWLRVTAIASNFAFIYYAAVANLLPVLVLHSILLPVNVTRLAQIQLARASGRRRLAASDDGPVDVGPARAHFLSHQALADPVTALSLAEREQQRVACMLASRLPGSGSGVPPASADEGGRDATILLDEIDRFLTDLTTGGGLAAAETRHLAGLHSRGEVLRELHDTLGELAKQLRDSATHLPGWLADALTEGLGTILLIAEDAARSFDDVDLLLRMTSDRSALVEQLRSKAATNWSDGEAGDHRAVYIVTALYERTVWLLRRYAGLLETAAAREPGHRAGDVAAT